MTAWQVPRRFQLNRLEDPSGVSGVGVVAFGVEFPSGRCVVDWATGYQSTGVYADLSTVVAVHGHQGRTVIEWLDE